MLEENLDGVKVESLSDDELDKQLKENFGVVDDKEGEETSTDPSSENKPNEDTPPSSQGEEDKGDEKKKDVEEKKEKDKPESNNTEDEKEKEVPFHKHPRFQKLVRDKKEAETKNKDYEDRLQKLENPKVEEKLPPIPGWFAGDENDWQVYNQEQQARDEKIANNAVDKFNTQQQTKDSEVKKMENWVDEEVDKLQDDPDVGDFKRNELLKIMTDYKPTDENGNLDFQRGYKLMVQLKGNKQIEVDDKKKGEVDAKKKIISTDKSTGSGNDDSKLVTADDIRHKSFGQLAV